MISWADLGTWARLVERETIHQEQVNSSRLAQQPTQDSQDR
jgi:hypothetical protein